MLHFHFQYDTDNFTFEYQLMLISIGYQHAMDVTCFHDIFCGVECGKASSSDVT